MESIQIERPQQIPFQVVVVGAGLGGLSCAISCRRANLQVTVLEKAAVLGEVGAGIQMPPNATRVMHHFGLVDKIVKAGAVIANGHQLLDWKTGDVILQKPGGQWQRNQFGAEHYFIHRADYHRVLLDEATRLGADIVVGCEVTSIDCSEPSVTLSNGRRYRGDVVIGADGLRSMVRDSVLGYHFDASETGEMAYRITIPRTRIDSLNSSFWNETFTQVVQKIWMGPRCHAVIYPIRNKTIWNAVFCCPDTLPPDTPQAVADIQDLRNVFRGWDPKLELLLDCVDECLKWKICHMPEIERWIRGHATVLGDACHPTLPYQSQGAAMAVEDGAVLGVLLGALSRSPTIAEPRSSIPSLLELYQTLRKKRTELNVKGAIDMKHLYEMQDGPEQIRRNEELAKADLSDINDDCPWIYANLRYQKDLLAFDTVGDANQKYQEWEAAQQ